MGRQSVHLGAFKASSGSLRTGEVCQLTYSKTLIKNITARSFVAAEAVMWGICSVQCTPHWGTLSH